MFRTGEIIVAWGGMEMSFPWIRILEMTEVPITYLETAGNQQGSRREVQKGSSHKGYLRILGKGALI